MVRPKATEENLKIALGFANTVTTSCSDLKREGHYVDCKGPASIFAALSHCFPLLVRCSKPTDSRHAMSEIELNKHLGNNGYTRLRCRKRIAGTRHEWNKEYLRWKSVRWMDPNEPVDLEMLKSRWVDLIECYPCTSSLDHDTLMLFLSRVCSTNSQNTSSDSGSEALSLSRPSNSGARYGTGSGRNDAQPLFYQWRIPCAPLRFMQICNLPLFICFVHAGFKVLLRSSAIADFCINSIVTSCFSLSSLLWQPPVHLRGQHCHAALPPRLAALGS